MSHRLTTLFLLFISFSISAQDINMSLIANVPLVAGETGNDIWGFVDANGVEYAVMGTTVNTKIYSLADPANPVEVIVIPGTNSTWRDMKQNGDYIYVTTDRGADGLLIIDMSAAPTTVDFVFWQPQLTVDEDVNVTLEKCHNIYIDENGVAYLAGCNVGSDDFGRSQSGGVIFLDITTDPMAPQMIGFVDEHYSHDVYVRGDTLYSSEIYRGEFGVYDIADKSNPVYLGGAETSKQFCHNAWISDDGSHLFTTDERPNGFVDAYDITDIENPIRVDMFQPFETGDSKVIPHNTHFKDDYLITSWYTDGIIITDVSNPDIMVKVGSYDTFGNEAQIPASEDWFFGCWGAYPWLPSGLILASDRQTGLYVFEPNYVRASILRGNVINAVTMDAVGSANLELMDQVSIVRESTNATGDFGMGTVEAGTFDVVVSHPDYFSKTVSVTVSNGNTTDITIELDPLPATLIDFSVVRSDNQNGIEGAHILLVNSEREIIINTDASGNASRSIVDGDYDMHVGAWGFHYVSVLNFAPVTGVNTIILDRGYQDDFIFDYNWVSSGNAATGLWERVEPIGTYSGAGTEVNPETDLPDDLGELCYITGNGGGGVGDDDIDDGDAILTSDIMDLTFYDTPILEYRSWFVNIGGQGAANDALEFSITNGTETVSLETITESEGVWRDTSIFDLKSIITITDQMQIIATAADVGQGHVLECGLDQMFIREGMLSDLSELGSEIPVSITPNPFKDLINVTVDADSNSDQLQLQVFDIYGRLLETRSIKNLDQTVLNTSNWTEGSYLISITDGQARTIKKVVKQ